MPKMMEGRPSATRSRWRASSCGRGRVFCTRTVERMEVGSRSTAWRICSREVNSTSAPASTRARSDKSASTISAVKAWASRGSARVSLATSVPWRA